MHTLHWLPIQQHIFYRVAVLVWHGLHGIAVVYLQELTLYQPWLAVERFWSSSGGKLLVHCVNTSSMQCHTLSVVAACSSFPIEIRLLPKNNTSPLKLLKIKVFHHGWTGSAFE